MPSAMPLPNRISQNASRTFKQRTLVAQFGDGYFQTAADGPTSFFEEWEGISWDLLTAAERTTVVQAIAYGAVDYITWTPNGDPAPPKKYLIKPEEGSTMIYRETMQSGSLYTIQIATLVQIP